MSPPDPRWQRLTILEIMALIGGIALGIWLAVPGFREEQGVGDMNPWFVGSTFLLGGLSLVGPSLLLHEAIHRRRRQPPWGAGKVLWFSHGMASWLLWPPIVRSRIVQGNIRDNGTAPCFAYGTPLMALYVVAAMLAGGWFRRSKRRIMRRSWRERFGVLLALIWACVGVYVLSILYRGK